jgi:Cu+-exporting ATPase
MGEDELLRLGASVEQSSEHPLGAAVVRAARERGLELGKADGFDAPSGKGVTATVDGRRVTLGNTAIFVGVDGKAAGVLAFADPVKAMTPDALKALRADGIRVVMLTGDNRTTAETVARKLGIDEVEAEVLPQDKAKVVERLRNEGRAVAMAGDGVNDAPALAAAEVGVAVGTGTDVAMESAGVTLLRGDLQGLVAARKLSRATMGNIRQNLFFAFVCNAAGVPIAAGVLYPILGLLLSPIIAAAAMALSYVIANAARLRFIQL